MRLKVVLPVFALAALALSCDPQPLEPLVDEVAPAPLLNFIDGPEYPGNSPVERFTTYGWLTVTDFDQGLRLRLYDTFDTFRCGGSADDPDWWDYQDIWSNPDGILKSVTQSNEVPLVLYPWPTTPGKDFCDFLAEDYIAYGTGTGVANDNNVFWFMGTGGTNSYGLRVKGTLQDDAGNMYKVVGNNHYTARGLCCDPFVDPADIWVEVPSVIETIKVHPIKLGQD